MGQYIQINNLYEQFSEADIEGLAYGNEDKINAAINSAEALINGYIAPRYTLPLKNSHEIINDIACDIARYKLADIEPTEAMQKRYDDAVSTLGKISKGTIVLSEPKTGKEPSANKKNYVKAKRRRFLMDMY
ncbi:MAG: gp436 family protein [Alphaproteobacteria bacterium]